MRRLLVILFAATAGLAAGCGADTATVSGTVRYKGEPVTAGSVEVHVAGKRPATGPINPDGTYRVEMAPAGEAKIAIRTPRPAPSGTVKASGPTPGDAVAVKIVPVPERFADPEKSNVSVVVKPGSQQYDINITE